MTRALVEALGQANIQPPADLMLLQHNLEEMAERIAHNRVIAGLHYPMDSDAGAKIAELLMPALLNVPSFVAALAACQGEWT